MAAAPSSQPSAPSATPLVHLAQPGSTHIETLDKFIGEIDLKQDEVKVSVFRKAIDKIIKDNYLTSKPKLWEIDPFNGSDPCKLHTLLQCKLNFQEYLFQDEAAKFNYVLLYLKGTALDHFESAILDPIEPPWPFNFNLFTKDVMSHNTHMTCADKFQPVPVCNILHCHTST